MSKLQEQIFVGSMIGFGDRKVGYLSTRDEINSEVIQDNNLRIIFKSIKSLESLQAIINIDNLSRQILIDNNYEADNLPGVISELEFVANLGANSDELFHSIESQISLAKYDELLGKFVNTVSRVVNSPIGTSTDKAEALMSELSGISNIFQPESHVFDLKDQKNELKTYKENQRSLIGKRMMTLPPVFGRVNRYVPYIRKGLMYIVLGKTKGGKSSVMGQCADWLARGYKVAYCSFEDTIDRKLAQQCSRIIEGANFDAIYRGDDLDKVEEWEKVRDGWAKAGGELTYIYCAGQGAHSVIRMIDKLQQNHGCDVVFVDYIQKANIDFWLRQNMNETAGYTGTAELFKQRAEQKGKELAMFVGSQVSVGDNGKPYSKGSTAIMEKAQCVFYIERWDITKEDEISNEITLGYIGQMSMNCKLHVMLNNDGETGYEDMINIKPKFMFCAKEMLNMLPKIDQYRIPTMQALTKDQHDMNLRTEKAYLAIGTRVAPPPSAIKSTSRTQAKKTIDLDDDIPGI